MSKVADLEWQLEESESALAHMKAVSSLNQEKNDSVSKNLEKELARVTMEKKEACKNLKYRKEAMEEREEVMLTNTEHIESLQRSLEKEKQTVKSLRAEVKQVTATMEKKFKLWKKEAGKRKANEIYGASKDLEAALDEAKELNSSLEEKNAQLSEETNDAMSRESSLRSKLEKYRNNNNKMRSKTKAAMNGKLEMENELKMNLALLEKAKAALRREKPLGRENR